MLDRNHSCPGILGCPTPCLFILIALVILLLMACINPFLTNHIILGRAETGASYSTMSIHLAVLNIIDMFFRVIAIGLLITAVLFKRKASTALDAQDPGASSQNFGSIELYASMLFFGTYKNFSRKRKSPVWCLGLGRYKLYLHYGRLWSWAFTGSHDG
jgi:hypothetical protein